GPPISRHLRRHAADGRARPRICGDRGARLDPRRGRQDYAVRSVAEDPAHGLEYAGGARVLRLAPAPLTPSARPGGPACLFWALLPAGAAGRLGLGRAGRVWRADHRRGCPRQHGRHPIPSGKEPETWACTDREFPELEALNAAIERLAHE